MGRGLLDTRGNVIHPPPYFDVTAYAATARALQALRPARLLTAHYAPLEDAEVDRFLADTLSFVEDAAAAVERELRAAGTLRLAELLERCDASLGPFTSMPNELAGSLRAHARSLVAAGRATEAASGLHWSWNSI
jgi:hypothetical protein